MHLKNKFEDSFPFYLDAIPLDKRIAIQELVKRAIQEKKEVYFVFDDNDVIRFREEIEHELKKMRDNGEQITATVNYTDEASIQGLKQAVQARSAEGIAHVARNIGYEHVDLTNFYTSENAGVGDFTP